MPQRPRRQKRTKIIVALVLLVALVWIGREAFFVEPDSLLVRPYAIQLPAWPAALDGFKIAAIGDLHGGAPFMDEKKLEEVVRLVNAEKPDVIVWLGDYVIQGVLGGHFMEPEKVAAILSKAQAGHGHYAIIGNHDRWLDTARVERAFEERGVTFLRWKSATLSIKGTQLHLYGLDDFELSPNYWGKFRNTTREWLSLPEADPLIVLSHSPDIFPSLPSRVTLTLAAHTHGGQVRLPLIGSLIVPSSFGQRYASGVIVENGRYLFVNPGIGTSIIPVRLGVPPEISILTLTHASAH